MEIVRQVGKEIDAVVTDVVMPERAVKGWPSAWLN